ncbi:MULTISPECIES: DUF3613 domain-containing protein [Stenotrophomonas]|uniref:DUF3613 domain-containing protein n=1 Tax=Stenotrophomonas TaxID=40323 RepID=UPI000D541087|nr:MULTISPECIES: DUF3613 domain-containing protein [Stenotrophomonas]AWH29443.1 DUF3613 domain-containing protein [Stenotrophomonas sp. YAU14A_MKIMI4_1]AWH33434.1 DUF3613 domain-containing protein [Stenotrophomonas sp. SAU14A_NAIMI4_8]
MTLPALLRTVLPLATLAVALSAPHASAQSTQSPLTGQMLGERMTPAPTVQSAQPLATVDTTAAPPAPPPPTYIPASTARPQHGDSVRNLLRLQASGQQAGARLPILGDQATASYARYLKSFEHEIPDFFDPDVGRSSNRSSSSR